MRVVTYSVLYISCFFFFKQKTAYEMRISDWSSDVCSSDLVRRVGRTGIADMVRSLRQHLAEVETAALTAQRAGPAQQGACPAEVGRAVHAVHQHDPHIVAGIWSVGGAGRVEQLRCARNVPGSRFAHPKHKAMVRAAIDAARRASSIEQSAGGGQVARSE